MNIKPIVAPLAVAVVTVGAVTATATGAFAATPTSTSSAHAHLGKDATLSQIQAAGAKATASRITKLNAALGRVNDDKTLTSSDRSTLSATLHTDLSGMQQLQTKIAADTTTAQARTDYATIFSQYRVIAVALPQERIVRDADRVTAKAVPHLQAVETKLAARVAKKSDASQGAKTALADLQQQISTAQSDAQGLASAALAVTPGQYNASHTVMSSLRTKAKALRTAAKTAQKDIRTIRHDLRG
ncbi:hypothetical protein [Amnibacterium kyonggiense]